MNKIYANSSLETVVEKINELVDFANDYYKNKIAECEREINRITLNASITNNEIIPFFQAKLNELEIETK